MLTLKQAKESLALSLKTEGKKGVRKAYAAMGDDVSLSRFVKIKNYKYVKPKQKKLFGRSIENDRTNFLKSVQSAKDVRNVLVSGFNNVKIGRDVRKGRLFRGYWIYTLTLEERKTCPNTCAHWTTCYGNNMPFAKRIKHDGALISRLQAEIPALLGVRGRKGLLVRLHALGDFFSVEYVQFWALMLELYPKLAIFGYTARTENDSIGREIKRTKERFGRRFSIRWSSRTALRDGAIPIFQKADCPEQTFICPEQTRRTDCCATCGLCWNTDKNVAFLEH